MDYFYAIKRTNNKNVRLLDSKISGIIVMSVAIAKKDISIDPTEHSHAHYELHCVTNGRCIFMLDGKPIALKPYDIFIVPPNTPHQIVNETEDFSKLAISFRMTSSYSQMKFVTGIVHSCDENERRTLEVLMNYEEKCIVGDVATSYLMAKSLLIQFLFEDNSNVLNTYFSATVSDETLIYYVRQYINENCFDTISARNVADYCGISQRHLNRLLKDCLGCTINDLVNEEKLLRVGEMLKNGATVREISETLGYSNEFSLLRFVKNKTGKNISEIRMEMQIKGDKK